MMTWSILLMACLAGDPVDRRAEEIASTIDRRIAATLVEKKIEPASKSTDAEFFRRLTLDLRGHIPSAEEARAFLDDSSSDKRTKAIRSALEHPDHRKFFAVIWRRLLLPEAESEAQIQYFVPGFEAWLEEVRERDIGFDQIVRDLVSARIDGTPDAPQMVLTDLSAPNPIAYIATKEADPAKIAAGMTRLFLGLRLECAQCHDHPFDQWSRTQFWNQAAFFSGIARRGKGSFAPVSEARNSRSIAIMGTGAVTPAVFLDGGLPEFEDGRSPRVAYAAWMTSPKNPFFAKAVVNRVWGQLMGTGIVDPVDDFQAMNQPSHPELLDDLAQAFIDSGFQLDIIYAGIALSDAYQRSSRQTEAAQADARNFAKAAVKPMTAEQLYDSVQLALGETKSDQPGRGRNRGGDKRKFLDLFATPDASGEPLASMPQALFLLNGRTTNRGAEAGDSRLKSLLESPHGDRAKAIEELYLTMLGRLPTEAESQRALEYVRREGESAETSRLADVAWVLFNLPEFRWNH